MINLQSYLTNVEVRDRFIREARRARAMAMYVTFLQTLEGVKQLFGGGKRRPVARTSRRFALHG